ncbi:hypothetical protein [Flavobacterium olei]|uniref:hypothetical protein n=1 Tax=Flavobacterium olei TaxID=1886782 RepID=UPI00321B9482
MKKIIYLTSLLAFSNILFSQINSPNGDNIFYYNGAADVTFRFLPRGNGGRAIVHDTGNVLSLNYGGDFSGGTQIGSEVFFKDGGNSYINSGNLGIGSSSPAYKLDVFGSIGVGSQSVNANTTKIFLKNPAGKTWAISSGANMITESSFSIYNWSLNQTVPVFNISDNGNVSIGIGSEAFQSKLMVKENGSSDNIWRGRIVASGDLNAIVMGEYGGKSWLGAHNSQLTAWSDLILQGGGGNVGIGIDRPSNKLDVNGTIHSKEVKVDMNGWSDFVFRKEYELPTLEQVEKHIVEKGYLENMPSEEEVLKNGNNLGEMDAKLLQKIEELTLYVIEQNKRLNKLEEENEELKRKMKSSKKQ